MLHSKSSEIQSVEDVMTASNGAKGPNEIAPMLL